MNVFACSLTFSFRPLASAKLSNLRNASREVACWGSSTLSVQCSTTYMYESSNIWDSWHWIRKSACVIRAEREQLQAVSSKASVTIYYFIMFILFPSVTVYSAYCLSSSLGPIPKILLGTRIASLSLCVSISPYASSRIKAIEKNDCDNPRCGQRSVYQSCWPPSHYALSVILPLCT